MGTPTATQLKNKLYEIRVTIDAKILVTAATFLFNAGESLVFVDHDQKPVAAFKNWISVVEIVTSSERLSIPSDGLQKVQSLSLA